MKDSLRQSRSEALRLFARFCCRARRSIRLIVLLCRLVRWVVQLRFMKLAGDCKWMIENRLCKYQNNGMIERLILLPLLVSLFKNYHAMM
jgi:hypothetical protein